MVIASTIDNTIKRKNVKTDFYNLHEGGELFIIKHIHPSL